MTPIFTLSIGDGNMNTLAEHTTERRPWLTKLRALLVVLALVAAACSSTTTDTDAAADTETDDTTTEVAAEQVEAEEEPVEEEPEEEPEPEPEVEEEPVDLEPIVIPDMGTSVEITFDIETESFEVIGLTAVGRAGALSPVESGLVFSRPTGFVSLGLRGNGDALPLFTETLETWFTHPEVNISSQSETTVGGFDATVTDFTIERADTSLPDCGPPPLDQCIFFASTPAPSDASVTVARTGVQLRLWEVDQGEHASLLIFAVANPDDDEWLSTVDAAMETIVLGEPQPAPEEIVGRLDAGEHTFDSLGGLTMTIPEPAFFFEGAQCVLIQFPDDTFESGMLFGRIDQNGEGAAIADDQAYFDSFDGQVSREETGRTVELFGTTLTEFAVEETGQNMSSLSCAAAGDDPTRDVIAGFTGAGTEYVADAEDGGFYLAGWITVNPEASDRWMGVFDEIVSSIEVAGS